MTVMKLNYMIIVKVNIRKEAGHNNTFKYIVAIAGV